jgi:hypothetical protein
MIIMKNDRKFVLIVIVLSALGTTFVSATTTGLTFGEITLSPPAPIALSTVSLTLSISGDTPSEVYIMVQECNGGTGICYPDKSNVTMSETTTNHYEGIVTLKHADATYITCIAYAKTTSGWNHSTEKKVYLSENTSDGNQTDGENNNGKSPGFEVIVFVAAIGISVILLARKRFR